MPVTPFWPQTQDQVWVFIVSILFAEVAVAAVFFFCRPSLRNGTHDPAHLMKLIEWERDRVMSAAKGIGATAGAFLAGLITALLSAEIKAEVPQSAVLGCLLGAVGALFIAVDLAKSTQGFVEGAVP